MATNENIVADQGNKDAQLKLATFYLNGTNGVTKDTKKGFQLLQRLTNLGNSQALYLLARCYYDGTGIAKDKEYATELFIRAADQGIEAAKQFLENIDSDVSERKAKKRKL